MKKLVLFAAFFVAVTFSACSSKAKETPVEGAAEVEVVEPAVEESVVVEEVSTDSIAVPAETPVQ